MTEIATIDCFGRWGTSVFSENTAIFNNCRTKLINGVRRESARQGSGYNKLRLYKCLKSETKPKMMPRGHRTAYSKFRCGVAPIHIEIGIYERLALEDRRYFSCLKDTPM